MNITLDNTVTLNDNSIEFNRDGINYTIEFDSDLMEYLNNRNDYDTIEDYEGSPHFESDIIEYIIDNFDKCLLMDY
jgi:hypothetical protein